MILAPPIISPLKPFDKLNRRAAFPSESAPGSTSRRTPRTALTGNRLRQSWHAATTAPLPAPLPSIRYPAAATSASRCSKHRAPLPEPFGTPPAATTLLPIQTQYSPSSSVQRHQQQICNHRYCSTVAVEIKYSRCFPSAYSTVPEKTPQWGHHNICGPATVRAHPRNCHQSIAAACGYCSGRILFNSGGGRAGRRAGGQYAESARLLPWLAAYVVVAPLAAFFSGTVLTRWEASGNLISTATGAAVAVVAYLACWCR